MMVDLDTRAETAVLRAELAALKLQMRAFKCAVDADRARGCAMVAEIRSIFSRSVASGGTIETIADHFAARLDVMARYHRTPVEWHDFEMMLRDELREFQFGEDPRITIAGEMVWLHRSQAQLLGLAFHELITNALKFGALSQPSGRLHVTWSVVAGEVLLDWYESGVAVAPAAPLHRGVGRDFIEQELPHQLGARGRFTLCQSGLRCHIAFALTPSARLGRGGAGPLSIDHILLQ